MNHEYSAKIYHTIDKWNDKNLLWLVCDGPRHNPLLAKWKFQRFGWEYQLWYDIGERGGLIEAKELTFTPGGNDTFEKYIAYYRLLITNSLSIEELFKEFSVTCTIEIPEEQLLNPDSYMAKKVSDAVMEFRFSPIEITGKYFQRFTDVDTFMKYKESVPLIMERNEADIQIITEFFPL